MHIAQPAQSSAAQGLASVVPVAAVVSPVVELEPVDVVPAVTVDPSEVPALSSPQAARLSAAETTSRSVAAKRTCRRGQVDRVIA